MERKQCPSPANHGTRRQQRLPVHKLPVDSPTIQQMEVEGKNKEDKSSSQITDAGAQGPSTDDNVGWEICKGLNGPVQTGCESPVA